jgi:hypothetical protein
MADHPNARELGEALATVLRELADQAPPDLRMRLLVAAHAAGLLARDDGAFQETDEPALAAALRKGDHDTELPAVAARLRADVAARLRITSPGYAR